jgi:hypothetical protein
MLKDAPVATGGLAVASSRECVVALLRAWVACCLRRRAGHPNDLPGLTVRVRSAMLYAPERLSLHLMAMTRAGGMEGMPESVVPGHSTDGVAGPSRLPMFTAELGITWLIASAT